MILQVCVCIYIYTYIYVYTCVYIYVYICIYMYIYIYLFNNTSLYVCIYYIHTRIFPIRIWNPKVFIQAWPWPPGAEKRATGPEAPRRFDGRPLLPTIDARIHIHIYICIYIYIYTHTNTCMYIDIYIYMCLLYMYIYIHEYVNVWVHLLYTDCTATLFEDTYGHDFN